MVLGPELADDLLEDTMQGGVDFELFKINLVGLPRKLDSVIESNYSIVTD